MSQHEKICSLICDQLGLVLLLVDAQKAVLQKSKITNSQTLNSPLLNSALHCLLRVLDVFLSLGQIDLIWREMSVRAGDMSPSSFFCKDPF